MPDFATNLHRLMARQGLTIAEVVERTGLDERTIKAILNQAQTKPHARTLHRLASGLGVPVDELFQDASWLARRSFDRVTNPVVDTVVADHPQLFHGWTPEAFDELYSHVGTGGGLTTEGAIEMAKRMNRRHEVLEKVQLLMESSERDLLMSFVDLLYERVVVRSE